MNTRNLSLAVAVLALLTGAVGATGASAAVGPTDLVLTKADSADPVVSGGSLTYTITVRNTGANDASGVVVTDTLPSELDFVSATSSLGACSQAGKTVTCNLGQVNAGVTATATIAVTAKKDGTISNTATVASADDTNGANNTDTETTVISKKVTGNAKGKNKASCAAPSISGTPGNDVLTGTEGADVIRGFAGDDRIIGLGGPDLICADFGNDVVLAGGGKDTVIGGAGNDGLFGGVDADLLKGKSGRDRLRGQRGNDGLVGGKGRDSCKGGAGRDFIAPSCRP